MKQSLSEEIVEESDSNQMKVSHSYVHQPHLELPGETKTSQEKMDEIMRDYLLEIADAFNVELPVVGTKDNGKHSDVVCESNREREPLSEFDEMEELLTGAFPDVFMFGKTYGRNTFLNAMEWEHLLLQFTDAAATNNELQCYLYDSLTRRKVVNNIAKKV